MKIFGKNLVNGMTMTAFKHPGEYPKHCPEHCTADETTDNYKMDDFWKYCRHRFFRPIQSEYDNYTRYLLLVSVL